MAHLRLNGVDGSAATIADPGPAFDETAIIDVRADVALDDVSFGQTLVARWGQANDNRAWYLALQNPTGKPYIAYRDSGGAAASYVATVSLPSLISDGERIQVRGLLNTTAGTADYYTRDPALGLALSLDTSWSALGTTVAVAGADIFVPTIDAPIYIGARGLTVAYDQVATGNFYGAYVRKGGATPVVNVNFADTSTWVYS